MMPGEVDVLVDESPEMVDWLTGQAVRWIGGVDGWRKGDGGRIGGADWSPDTADDGDGGAVPDVIPEWITELPGEPPDEAAEGDEYFG